MTGIHGSTSASGARAAVLPAPVRRALLLAALLCGITVATWAAASDAARADGHSLATTLVYQAGTTTEAHTGEYVPIAPTGLRAPLAGTVAALGEGTAQVVSDASASVVPGARDGGADVVGQVSDAVDEVTDPAERRLPEEEVVPAPPADGQRPGAGPDGGSRDGTAEAVEDDAVPSVYEAHTPSPPAYPDPGTGQDADRADGAATAPVGHDAPSASATAAAPSAPGGAGTPGGALVAGYLTAHGAPAPSPGLFQAARHVLRSAPAESADEPTFSPD
ncbi:hypothetical protein ACIRPH_19195 [Nocardiopsis sp. NPDC101807]|uniref:hypothetical protein n=1 Tax=Nocardiopsis sp. NPDC101807 TaxID=3364339 RepID=UPI003829927D